MRSCTPVRMRELVRARRGRRTARRPARAASHRRSHPGAARRPGPAAQGHRGRAEVIRVDGTSGAAALGGARPTASPLGGLRRGPRQRCRYSRSVRPCSDAAMVCATACSESLLAIAQRGLHLARVVAAGPRQHQRGQSQQQQLQAQRHGVALPLLDPAIAHAVDGLQRVELRIEPWNLRRMRFTCEVMVLSSSTTFAASISCWRLRTWPGMARERVHDPELGQRQQHHLAVPLRLHALAVERAAGRGAARPPACPACAAPRRGGTARSRARSGAAGSGPW